MYGYFCGYNRSIMYIVYGIPNCDIIKKVTQWLQNKKISYNFHDYKKDNISAEKLQSWCSQVGWETIFNKRSTTWKELGEARQAKITNEKAAIEVMREHTSIIKRPVIEKDGKVIVVGFDAVKYEQLISK